VEPYSKKVAVGAELDHRRVELPGGMLRLNHEIFNFSARISTCLPAAETASSVPYSESAVGAVEIEAHDGLQDVLAEYA
jgi:hypothetical protein